MAEESPRILSPSDLPAAPRNPWIAALASFLLPGAGQALNGRFWKATWLLFLSLVNMFATWLSYVHFNLALAAPVFLVLLLPWVYSTVDAAREAKRLNERGIPFDSGRAAKFVSLLLLVVFPIVVLVFSTVTIVLLPIEVVDQINDRVSKPLRRAMGLRE